MNDWIGAILDIVLILVVGAGVVQAMRLIRQLRDLRASRQEMERFVHDFNGAVMRAEAGIKSLRAAARESGDDLEKLVEKAIMVRDELHFIVESADGIAERLSTKASNVIRADSSSAPNGTLPTPPSIASRRNGENPTVKVEQRTSHKPAATPAKKETSPVSRAEQELLQVLQKLSGGQA